MTLDEAIKHCEEVMMENLEKTKDRNASDPIAINCFECAAEHHQLAEWFKDYKRLLEQDPCGDAISRQATAERLFRVADFMNEKRRGLGSPYVMAALFIQYNKDEFPPVTPQPCEDCFSKQAAIIQLSHNKTGDDDCDVIIQKDIETIKALPPATPQPKIGRWIYGEDNLGTGRDGWYCNQCGHFEFWDYSSNMKSAKLNLPNPCPNCGARMSESKYYAGLSKSFAQGLRQGLQEGFAESEDKK